MQTSEAVRQRAHYKEVQSRLGIRAKAAVPDPEAELRIAALKRRIEAENALRDRARQEAQEAKSRQRKATPIIRKSREDAKAKRQALIAGLPTWVQVQPLIPSSVNTPEKVAAIVMGKFPGVTLDQIRSISRTDTLSRARALIAMGCRARGLTLEEIAQFMGKHHTAVIAMVERAGAAE